MADDDRGDWEKFHRIAAEIERETQEKLRRARAEAAARGKEAFDLDKALALYVPRDEYRCPRSREDMQRDYERYYHLSYREATTLEEFAELLRKADGG